MAAWGPPTPISMLSRGRAPTRSNSRRISPRPNRHPRSSSASSSRRRTPPATTTGSGWSSPPSQWQGLADHAAERGLIFLSSAFSLEAVELLDRLGYGCLEGRRGRRSAACPCLSAWPQTAGPCCCRAACRLGPIWTRRSSASSGRGAGRGPAMHDGLSLPAGKDRPERHRRATGSIRLPDRIVGSLGQDLCRTVGGHAGRQLDRGTCTFSRECFGPDVPASLTTEEMQSTRGRYALHRNGAGPSDRQASDG